MTSRFRPAFSLALLIGLASAAPAQTFTITQLHRELDTIQSGGNDLGTISFANPTAVNNAGSYLASFDLANSAITPNFVTIRDGAVFLQGGQSLPEPAGATFSRLGIFNTNINNHGDFAGFITFANQPTANDSGLYWNAAHLLLQKNISIADVAGLTPNTPYIGFFGSRLNDNNQILILASVDDMNITSSVDRVAVRLDYNPAANTFTQTLLLKEGDTLPGQPAGVTVADITTTANEYDFNNAGDFLYRPTFTGAGAINGIYKNTTPIALAGQPSPIPGRNYLSFAAARALNNTGAGGGGGVVFRARLDGDTATDEVIIRGNQVFVQEGDTVDGKTIVEFGTGAPVLIDDQGNVVWYGRWSTAGPRIGGLFYNHRLILEDGVTQVNNGADTIKNVRWISEAFSMSDNGRTILARVIDLSATGEADAVIRITVTTCPADADGDGQVTPSDVAFFVNIWFTSLTQGALAGDFDGSGQVDPADIALFIATWFTALTSGC